MTENRTKITMICSEHGCDNDVHATGLCSAHYSEKRRIALAQSTDRQTCSHEDCALPVEAKELCRKHYMADYRARRRAEAQLAA